MADLISIIVRTYNAQDSVGATLESIFSQTIDQSLYEVIVIDDGSTDGTLEVVRPYEERITLLRQDHTGPMHALNRAIKHTKGNYMIILDSDDTFEPEILQELYGALKQDPEAAFAYCDYHEKDLRTGQKAIVSTENVFSTLAEGILFPTEVIKKLGMYDVSLFFPEYDILIKLTKTHKGIRVPEPLFTYNRHDGSLTSNQDRVKLGKQQLKARHGNIPEIASIRDY